MRKTGHSLLLAIFALGAAPLFGQTQETDPDTRDATEIARIKGISVAEAKRRAALEVEAAELGARLQNNPNFSGLYIISNAIGFEVRARFKSGAAAALRSVQASPELAAALKPVEGGLSVAEQASLRGRLVSIMARERIESRISVDPTTGRMELAVKDPASVRPLLGELAESVEIVQEDRPLPLPVANLLGGYETIVTKTDGTTGRCTTGFGARDSTTSGLLTAAHCHLLRSNVAVKPGSSATTQGVTLSVKSGNWSGPRDFLWLTGSGHAGTNKIWDGQFQRAITSGRTTSPANGSSVCKYGVATGYTCQLVRNNNRTFADPSGYTIGPLVELATESGLVNIA
jgi:hypothetical protein